jgi:hypothetical protein
MKELIGPMVLGAGATVGAFMLWAAGKWAVSKYRAHAEKTPTKADDKLADELDDALNKFKPGED